MNQTKKKKNPSVNFTLIAYWRGEWSAYVFLACVTVPWPPNHPAVLYWSGEHVVMVVVAEGVTW